MSKKYVDNSGILLEAQANKSEDMLNTSVFAKVDDSDRYNGANFPIIPTINNTKNAFTQRIIRPTTEKSLLSYIETHLLSYIKTQEIITSNI